MRAADSACAALQPKKVAETRYAARDAKDAAAAARAAEVDPHDPAAVKFAQEEAEMRMMAEQIGGGEGAATAGLSKLDEMSEAATSKGDFEAFAKELVDTYGAPHAKSKQYKAFVKAIAKGLCEVLDKDGVKDVETALAGLRSDKVKADLKAAADAKKGASASHSVCCNCTSNV
jgi:Translation initiation factor eIF3 subunit